MKRTFLLFAMAALMVILFAPEDAFAKKKKKKKPWVYSPSVVMVQCVSNTPCNGTSINDIILGTSATDQINALAGNDTIEARGADDTTDGGDGDDTFSYKSSKFGNDTLLDGSQATNRGKDNLDFSTLSGPVSVFLEPDTEASDDNFDEVEVYSPIDYSTLLSTVDWDANSAEIEDAKGGNSDDFVLDSFLSNTIWGGGGIDLLLGGVIGGTDSLSGDDGNDTLFALSNGGSLSGGNGDDGLVGNHGNNTFSGGPGNDILLENGTGTDANGDGITDGTNDVYNFARTFGFDLLQEWYGNDLVDFTKTGSPYDPGYKSSEVSARAADLIGPDENGELTFGLSDGNLDTLVLEFGDDSGLAIIDFFANTSAELNQAGQGAGFIETFKFADGSKTGAQLASTATVEVPPGEEPAPQMVEDRGPDPSALKNLKEGKFPENAAVKQSPQAQSTLEDLRQGKPSEASGQRSAR